METLRPTAPRVSVLLPVYDAERYLDEAVESILAQTFSDFELLAIDDGSRDASLARLEAYARRDSRVRVVRQTHAGLVATLNAGLALARGELIARMDADDVSLPDRLSLQVSALAARSDIVCMGGGFDVIDAKNRLLNRVVPPCEHAAILAMALVGRSPICGSNAMFRRRDVSRRPDRDNRPSGRAGRGDRSNERAVEDMVQCPKCGAYVPAPGGHDCASASKSG